MNEIMWKNIVKPVQGTDDYIIRLMRFACWITKGTETYEVFSKKYPD